jgi:hypothetical protein
MVIFLSVLLLTIISLKDLPTLINKSWKKEIIVFSFLAILNLTMALFVLLDIQLPRPQDFINWIGKSTSHLFKWE